MLPPTAKTKEATFAEILMAAGTPLRKKDMEVFCDNSPSPCRNSLNRKA